MPLEPTRLLVKSVHVTQKLDGSWSGKARFGWPGEPGSDSDPWISITSGGTLPRIPRPGDVLLIRPPEVLGMEDDPASNSPFPHDDPRHAVFGKLVWEWIGKQGGDFCGREESEEILPLAQAAGLVRRVKYDPQLHGWDIEADPGVEIWFWGEETTPPVPEPEPGE